MRTIEDIRQSHRNNIILHIGNCIYGRHPSGEQIKKIEVLLDIGRSIPEILSALRRSDEKIADPESTTEYSVKAEIDDYSESGTEFLCMRTPLEKYFHGYVS